MKRPFGMPLTLATVIAMLLAVASASLWLRGLWSAEGWIVGGERNVVHLISVRGGIYCAWFEGMDHRTATRWHAQPANSFDYIFRGGFRFAGLGYVGRHYTPPTSFNTFRALAIPHWLTIGACAAIITHQARRARRQQRRHDQGLCLKCGYDLRASPGRCPECGEPAVSTSVQTA